MARYMYIPLPPIEEVSHASAFTRILTLSPGVGNDPLYCTLDIADVQNCAWPYEALSYVWGSEGAPMPLYCGYGQLAITLNLEQALRHLRLSHAYRRLWVDAICVNQDDMRERGRQVGYMRLVYQHATTVIAWLGPSALGTMEMFDFARRLSGLQKDMLHTATGAPDGRTQYSIKQQSDVILVESFAAEPRISNALALLFAEPYFERVWCIQEAVTSRHCIAKCGQFEIDFFDLLSLASLVCKFRGIMVDAQGLEYPDGTISFWGSVLAARRDMLSASKKQYVEGSVGRMFTLLAGIRNFKCTDQRDRIFALLGISDEGLQPTLAITQVDGGENSTALLLLRRGVNWLSNKLESLGPDINFLRHPALKPSYTKSVMDVYRDFTRFSVRQQPRRLDILSLVQHTTASCDSYWPSWIPKLHEQRSVSLLPPGLYLSGIPVQGHYAYFAELHDCPLTHDPVEPNVLQLDGFHVDQIDAVSDLIHYEYTSKPPIEDIWNQLFNFALFPRQNLQYPGSQEQLDVAFFQSLAAGMLGVIGMFVNQPEPWGDSRFDAWDGLSRQVKSNILAWLQSYLPAQTSSYTDIIPEAHLAELPGEAHAYLHSIWLYSRNRRMYRTRSGLVGLGPQLMQPGDQVVVLLGGSLPFILRPNGRDWSLIGDTYLHHDNILRGKEAMMVRTSGKSRIQTYKLS